MSSSLPKIALAITEHSMCQPGRPFPQGLGQEGSPGFEAFHTAKSEAWRCSRDVDAALRAPKTLLVIKKRGRNYTPTLALLNQLAITFAPWLKTSVEVLVLVVESSSIEINTPVGFVGISILDDTLLQIISMVP
jgi:hypothetical protein